MVYLKVKSVCVFWFLQIKLVVKKVFKKGVVMLKYFSVIVEVVFQEDMVEKICILDFIGDLDVFVLLVKELIRIVKIYLLD